MQVTRQQAMTEALSLLSQYNAGKQSITLNAPGDWQLASHNELLRRALRAIAAGACMCAVTPRNEGDLCAACFAKSVLEPEPPTATDDDVHEVGAKRHHIPGAVPSVAEAGFDDDDE